MRQEIDKRFPRNKIGKMEDNGGTLDLLTGLFGACTIASMYGVPIHYDAEQWPASEHFVLSDEEISENYKLQIAS
jgi:hypothetical protein